MDCREKKKDEIIGAKNGEMWEYLTDPEPEVSGHW